MPQPVRVPVKQGKRLGRDLAVPRTLRAQIDDWIVRSALPIRAIARRSIADAPRLTTVALVPHLEQLAVKHHVGASHGIVIPRTALCHVEHRATFLEPRPLYAVRRDSVTEHGFPRGVCRGSAIVPHLKAGPIIEHAGLGDIIGVPAVVVCLLEKRVRCALAPADAIGGCCVIDTPIPAKVDGTEPHVKLGAIVQHRGCGDHVLIIAAQRAAHQHRPVRWLCPVHAIARDRISQVHGHLETGRSAAASRIPHVERLAVIDYLGLADHRIVPVAFLAGHNHGALGVLLPRAGLRP